ncbi:MAG: hypothetical protein AAF907_05600, partial [Planctomycetota bacterium]
MDLTPRDFEPFSALLTWAAVFGTLAGLILGLAFVFATIARGFDGAKRFVAGLGGGLRDLVLISPKHVAAIAQLTWREALRRRALYVFALFGVLF